MTLRQWELTLPKAAVGDERTSWRFSPCFPPFGLGRVVYECDDDRARHVCYPSIETLQAGRHGGRFHQLQAGGTRGS
jgi:hypothetical protein